MYNRPTMKDLITTTDSLAALCERLASAEYVTVDTEFMRESTYWPQLCLIQIAGPDEAVAIDPLAAGLDLGPLHSLMANPAVLKVFHSGRQDIEIFVRATGTVPTPIFDTQIAAMVCGFGEQVSYEALVSRLASASVDKSSRFTDWSRRPLTERQVTYAISDVSHLRPAYEKLRRQLDKSGRTEWVADEMAALADPSAYVMEPREAWRRIKVKTTAGRFLAVLREVAAWREREAQKRDLPRQRLIKDEALMEIASHLPRTPEELSRVRGLGRSMAEGRQGQELLAAVEAGLACPRDDQPKVEPRASLPQGIAPTVELLRVLLKLRCDDQGVAQKLVASAADLEAIAANDEADVPALKGWRREIFGSDALDLKHGRVALAIRNSKVREIRLDSAAE